MVFANWVKNIFSYIPFNSLSSQFLTLCRTYLIHIKLTGNVHVNTTDYSVFIAIVATACIFNFAKSHFPLNHI